VTPQTLHACPGVAPLKQLEIRSRRHARRGFHASTGVAPLKLGRRQGRQRVHDGFHVLMDVAPLKPVGESLAGLAAGHSTPS